MSQVVQEEEVPVEEDEGESGQVERRMPPQNHGMGNALHAQALWDAAMGHSVVEALIRHDGALVVHYAGSFHVEKDGSLTPSAV